MSDHITETALRLALKDSDDSIKASKDDIRSDMFEWLDDAAENAMNLGIEKDTFLRLASNSWDLVLKDKVEEADNE